MTLQTVHDHCQSFLTTYFGPEEAPDNDEQRECRAYGLRLVTLGIERAVQGELTHYLRTHGLKAVVECAVAEQNIDIGIFGRDWTPCCLIQLKHRSANQGTISVLLKNMDEDVRKHAAGAQAQLPLVQVGLYTEITSSFSREAYEGPVGLYRFLAAYYTGAPINTVVSQKATVLERLGATLVAPAPVSFAIPGAVIKGRVGWILKVVEA